MQAAKKINKGEKLFIEGEKADRIFVIQSGRVVYYFGKAPQRIEIEQVGSGQMAGLQALFGGVKYPFTAEAITPVTFLEMPLDLVKTQIEAMGSLPKTVLKSLSEDIKSLSNDLRALKLKEEAQPCPQTSIPRIFGAFYYIANQIGKITGQGIEVEWGPFRTYATRVFLESPIRLEFGAQILTKLGLAETIYVKNENDQDELNKVVFKNLEIVTRFYDFYQYHMYKGGRSEIIFCDSFVMPRLKGLVEAAKDLEPGRNDVVKVAFEPVAESLGKNGVQFKLDHISFFERKGLFMNRANEGGSNILSFGKGEFSDVYEFWRIINEIDKWNALGHVNMKEDEPAKKVDAIPKCSSCGGEISDQHKFCPHCGFKLS